ncbi:hypothetical protein Tco_0773802 [Tanacetum coccineum]|uniref:Uncharacterized protein n=1 Tax=Tanacetum coccineum TaxID=301880 RepID=A0ABQ4ZNZ5_9ASTR
MTNSLGTATWCPPMSRQRVLQPPRPGQCLRVSITLLLVSKSLLSSIPQFSALTAATILWARDYRRSGLYSGPGCLASASKSMIFSHLHPGLGVVVADATISHLQPRRALGVRGRIHGDKKEMVHTLENVVPAPTTVGQPPRKDPQMEYSKIVPQSEQKL